MENNTLLPEVHEGNTLLPEVHEGNTLLPEVHEGNTLLPEVHEGNTLLPEVKVNEENTAEILLNGAYGGFDISKEAVAKYNEKLKEINPEHRDLRAGDYRLHAYEHRMNPILINIVKELGDKANGKFCKIYIETFNSELKNYIRIHEYDGQESIYADISLYRNDKIKEIINSEISDSDKIIKIKELLNRIIDW
jgi:hypothetical protein